MGRLIFLTLTLAIGCGGAESAGGADAAPPCTTDPRAQTYVPGMEAVGDDGIAVVLVTADPAPPVRFENTWSALVRDAQGRALESPDLQVDPYMPDHGHGTPRPPLPTPGEETGTFDMGPFDLWMPGIWEVRFTVTHDLGTTLTALTLCIEE